MSLRKKLAPWIWMLFYLTIFAAIIFLSIFVTGPCDRDHEGAHKGGRSYSTLECRCVSHVGPSGSWSCDWKELPR